MARWLRQSTSVDVPIGPFLDATDGVTAETALTLTQPDIRLKKNNAAWAQKNAAQTLSHEENGFYEVTLDATDTNTLGLLRLAVFESGAAPVWEDFLVVPANVWDSYFGADFLIVDAEASVWDTVAGDHQTDGTFGQAIGDGIGGPSILTFVSQATPTSITEAVWAYSEINTLDPDQAGGYLFTISQNLTVIPVLVPVESSATSNGTTTTLIDTGLTGVNGSWVGSTIFFQEDNDGLSRRITAYDAGTKTLTFTPALPSITETGDLYNIIADSEPAGTQVWNYVVETEGSITAQQALQGMIAMLFGEVSGAGTGIETFTTPDGADDRLVITVDVDGNRTAIVFTP